MEEVAVGVEDHAFGTSVCGCEGRGSTIENVVVGLDHGEAREGGGGFEIARL